MTILELKDQIMHNTMQNFYIFVGEEIGIINIYLKQMSNKLNLPITRADSVASIYSDCMGGSLFGDNNGFYVIRNDTDFPKAEKTYPTISKDIRNNTIVLLYDKLDSRLKFGKYFKDSIVTFEKLTPSVLKTYINREINLSERNTQILMDVCNNSYDMCMLEIDKIKQYCESKFTNVIKTEITTEDEAFTELLENGIIYQPQDSDVWKFTDAVCNRKSHMAYSILEILQANGNSSINILGTLYNSLKSVMLIQCCDKGDNITEVTGLDNKQIYFNKKYLGKYSTYELVNAVKLIIKVVDGVKSGWIDDVYATKYVLSSIL